MPAQAFQRFRARGEPDGPALSFMLCVSGAGPVENLPAAGDGLSLPPLCVGYLQGYEARSFCCSSCRRRLPAAGR
jgi:hypothetical protein